MSWCGTRGVDISEAQVRGAPCEAAGLRALASATLGDLASREGSEVAPRHRHNMQGPKLVYSSRRTPLASNIRVHSTNTLKTRAAGGSHSSMASSAGKVVCQHCKEQLSQEGQQRCSCRLHGTGGSGEGHDGRHHHAPCSVQMSRLAQAGGSWLACRRGTCRQLMCSLERQYPWRVCLRIRCPGCSKGWQMGPFTAAQSSALRGPRTGGCRYWK